MTKGFGKGKLYEAAQKAMLRRGAQWTEADETMWNEVFKMTQPERTVAVRKGRRLLAAKRG